MTSIISTRAALLGSAMMAVALATSPTLAQTSPQPAVTPDDIIVTGTRALGVAAADSAAPIKIVGAEMLMSVGQPNLNQALNQLVPSFTAQAHGGDTSNFTLSAKLRGLSPNHTLVLVNGKRRHPTANLQVVASPYAGGAAPDLDLIAIGAIKRIEVLEDGAAAQYGSDAIAGVINILLDDRVGVSGYASVGQHYESDGETYAGSATIGTKLSDSGFVNLTLSHRFHGRTQRGGADARFSNPDGSMRSSLAPALQAVLLSLPDYPNINRTRGDAKSRLTTLMVNAGYDIGDAQLYGFGSYGRRTGESIQNYRSPSQVVRSPTLGVAGAYGAPGATAFAPLGFSPRQALREDDYAITTGLRGDSKGWRWDLSSTYGYDRIDLSLRDSANRALFIDTGFSPSTFYNGGFIGSEWTSNLDISKDMEVGLVAPLTLSFGAEYRENSYAILQGDAASTYKEGGQGYPGFQRTDAGRHSRHSLAAYVDLAANPVDRLKLDLAGRYEHFNDFGGNVSGKLTARYDFTDAFALRGTISNGFRAPTLAEQFYSATNVTPQFATVQLPPNSAAAKLLGLKNLESEKSTNVSLGLVARPSRALTLTLDAYQIKIRDRILGTGAIYGQGGAINSPAVLAAIAAQGNVLDPTVFFTTVSTFANAADTRTRGVDFTASYATDLGGGQANFTLSANYNDTKLTNVIATPPQIAPQALFGPAARDAIRNGAPRYKIVGGANYKRDQFSVMIRETLYGKASGLYSRTGANFIRNISKAAFITDLELGYELTDNFRLTVGANNLFDKKADTTLPDSTGVPSDAQNIYDSPLTFTPYGINGGYYYARVNFTF